MTDFCKQCSLDVFDEDFGDLSGICPPCEPGEGYAVCCEGCGWILVDPEGRCIACDLKKGQSGHGS